MGIVLWGNCYSFKKKGSKDILKTVLKRLKVKPEGVNMGYKQYFTYTRSSYSLDSAWDSVRNMVGFLSDLALAQ